MKLFGENKKIGMRRGSNPLVDECKYFFGVDFCRYVDKRVLNTKIYVQGNIVSVLEKLRELGCSFDLENFDFTCAFLYVDSEGIVTANSSMLQFQVQENRQIYVSDLMKYEREDFILQWVKIGNRYQAEIPLPFFLRAKYVVTDGMDITLQRIEGSYPREGYKNIGDTYVDIDSAKRAAEEDYLHQLSINGLKLKNHGK
ncbi:hypothetical protein [Porphyromonas gingivicanis]|uniref:hypothetical protein n=1 Tax=Porphyromonas gingivicanis TaxID=266762 RepID=UPI000472DA3B|nr:hypothetical protein [Porphyromonas gingivicanis]